MAAKTGWAMAAGSHQPRSRAAVRCEKAAVLGSTSCHAASSSNCVRLSVAAYTPRVIRSHSRPRSHPRAGERGVLCPVTPEACGRGPQSSEPQRICGQPSLAGSPLWKPVTFHRPPSETGHSQAQNGPARYGLEVTGFLEWGVVTLVTPKSRRRLSERRSQPN